MLVLVLAIKSSQVAGHCKDVQSGRGGESHVVAWLPLQDGVSACWLLSGHPDKRWDKHTRSISKDQEAVEAEMERVITKACVHQ